MPLSLTLTLAAVVVVLLIARFAVPALPTKVFARPLGLLDAVLALVGVLGLVGHCGAMFYRGVITAIPGSGPYVRVVNALGVGSVVLYVLPAACVLIGLRRLQPVGVVMLALALLAVGITMYDGGPLTAHLVAISSAILILALFAALLITRIGGRRPDPQH